MSLLPTINSVAFHTAFINKDYPAMVKMCDEFARDTVIAASTDALLYIALVEDVANPRVRQHECTDECHKSD